MKKSFYFALALTAGLFASCSSDDLTADAPGGAIDVNDNDAVQININVDNPTQYTRGTGSVVGSTWGGQTFNLFMFERGTFNPAQYDAAPEGSEEPDMQDIYNNAVMTTTPGSSTAQQVIDDENNVQYQYFPTIGRFSFWAYRADDAADMTEGDDPEPIVKYTDATGADAEGDAATQVRIPFTIDGTQDLMVAETNTEAAKQKLMDDYGLDEDEAADYVYSAYAARREVNPTMKFYHQLTRLQFKVKAANRQASNKAEILAPGDDDYIPGIKVTKVEVWSKSTGSLIVAYKGEDPGKRIVWNDGQNWEAKATFDPDETTLTPFELMSRDEEPSEADIIMQPVNSARDGVAFDCADGYLFDGETSFTISDELVCYTSEEKDEETGLPTGEPTTIGEAKGEFARVFIRTYKEGTRRDGSSYNTYSVISDPSAPLVDLVPVTPKWEGYERADAGEPTWEEWDYQITSVTWTETTTAADIALAGDEPIDAAPSNQYGVKADKSGLAEGFEVNETVVWYYDAEGFPKYYKLTAVTDNVSGAQPYEGDEDPTDWEAGNVGEILYVEDGEGHRTYYKFYAVGAEGDPGHAVATPIGESMLVAPADDKGYIVRFTYWRSVMKTSRANDFVNRKGEAIINVKVKETANAGTEYEGMFKPGNLYTVTAVFYPDGRVSFEDGQIDEGGDGTGDLDGDVDNDGDVIYSTEN